MYWSISPKVFKKQLGKNNVEIPSSVEINFAQAEFKKPVFTWVSLVTWHPFFLAWPNILFAPILWVLSLRVIPCRVRQFELLTKKYIEALDRK